MLTTTASFVDIELAPSRLSAAALTLLYLGVAVLLLLTWLHAALPFPLVLCCLDMLMHEWLALRANCYSLQGRLVINLSGEVRWQQQKWHINRVKIRNRYFLLLRISCPMQARWLLICHDACSEPAYRALSLACYSPAIIQPDKH